MRVAPRPGLLGPLGRGHAKGPPPPLLLTVVLLVVQLVVLMVVLTVVLKLPVVVQVLLLVVLTVVLAVVLAVVLTVVLAVVLTVVPPLRARGAAVRRTPGLFSLVPRRCARVAAQDVRLGLG